MHRCRRFLCTSLDVGGTHEHTPFGRAVEWSIIVLIATNTLSVILETEAAIRVRYGRTLHAFDVFSVAVFTLEYISRLWACVELKPFRHPITGRIRFAVTPLALLDAMAVLPFYLPMLIHCDLRFLRVIRLMRLFRLLKTTRYFTAAGIIGRVFREKKEELLISLYAVVILLVLASSLMYEVEHQAQPKVFSSIPAAMWWGVVTLTTVGYGDIYPVTALGRVCAAAIALLSMGLFALPAGILASGFAQEVRRKREAEPRLCPHCHRPLHEPVED